jgi:aarF domain-containing kinase
LSINIFLLNWELGNLKIELKQGKLVIHLLDHGLYAVSSYCFFLILLSLVYFHCCIFQQLPTEFRENYAKLWMSIIRSNVREIEEVSEKLGVKELHGIFACMVSGRSWNAILGGIDKRRKTSEEEKEIKDDASKYLVGYIFFSAENRFT